MKIALSSVLIGLVAAGQVLAQTPAATNAPPTVAPVTKPIVNGHPVQPGRGSDDTAVPDPQPNDLLKQYPDQGHVTPKDIYGNPLDKADSSAPSPNK